MPKRGGSKGRGKPSLHSLSRERLTAADLAAFSHELTGSSDRACALVGGAFVDNALRDLLATHMRADWDDLANTIFDSDSAPLKEFSSRIKLAYAFGEIDDSKRTQLDAIRQVRNVFAHAEKPIFFGNTLVVKECKKLSLGERLPGATDRVYYRSAFAFTCVELFRDFSAITARRLNRAALADALAAYEPPTSPEK